MDETDSNNEINNYATNDDVNLNNSLKSIENSVKSGSPLNSFDLNKYCIISEKYEINVRKFRTKGYAFEVKFLHHGPIENFLYLLVAIFTKLLEKVFESSAHSTKVGCQIDHPGLEYPILTPFADKSTLTAVKLVNLIEKAAQSETTEFQIDDKFVVTFTTIEPPAGSGMKRFQGNFESWLKSKKSVVTITNRDNLCLFRALVVAIAYVEKDDRWRQICKHDIGNSLQKKLAVRLANKANIPLNKKCYGFEELKQIQAFLKNYQIKVWCKEMFNSLYFEGPLQQKILCLYLHNNHYSTITSLKGFFEKSVWCHSCNKGFTNKSKHLCCPKNCPCCKTLDGECCFVEWMYCKLCNRYFFSEECLDKHTLPLTRNGYKSVCDIVKRCTCGKLLNPNEIHKCFYTVCKNCLESYSIDDTHFCYIQPIKDDKAEHQGSFIFFDFECRQETVLDENKLGIVYKHTINSCVAYKVCANCWKNQSHKCNYCGVKRNVFFGDTTEEDFCNWLFSCKNKGSLAIAHNMKSYDGQFILSFLHMQGIKPDIISRGLEIIKLSALGITILDSMLFLPMKLSALCKAFNIQELKKGYFPFLFNTKENENYHGEFPDAWFFNPALMSKTEKNDFYEWYQKQKNQVFNLKNEILAYNESDTAILMKSCMLFRELFLKISNTDPFKVSFTIAGACFYVFRKQFLQPFTISIIPPNGYSQRDKQSFAAQKWLKWLTFKTNQKIQTTTNGFEKRIGKYKVDGFCDHTNTIYEFHGCLFHGCLKCFPDRNMKLPLTNITAEEAFSRTLEKQKFLEQSKFNLVTIWQCDLNKQLEDNSEMKSFFDSLEKYEPIKPNQALYGGRTSAVKLYHKCQNNEKIFYYDIISLYPFCNKYSAYPVGHPEIITENFKEFSKQNYFGLIKCIVEPPDNLYHPVLPVKVNGKLMFPLCGTCAREDNQLECLHTSNDRQILGTWVSEEVFLALDFGYKLVEIIEIWHYNEKTQDLFKDYINTFLKIKLESSGYPKWCETEKQKESYVKQVFEMEGINLNPSQIEVNNPMRSIAKLGANSCWGKFAQRNNLQNTVYFTNPKQYFETCFSNENVVHAVRVVNDNMVAVTLSKTTDYVKPSKNSNVVIAAFTTAYARMVLYYYLAKLQKRVLYCDTDSCIFLQTSENDYMPATGEFLGNFTNELLQHGKNSYICEFVSLGPKNYGYKVKDTNSGKKVTIVKIKGFNLDSTTTKQLNFRLMVDSVKKHVSGLPTPAINIIKPDIRKTFDRKVITKNCQKRYRIVYNKRRLISKQVITKLALELYSSVPFGYKL